MELDTLITSKVITSEYFQALPELITRELGNNMLNLTIYSLGMVSYAVVIWYFYRHLGRRTLFKVDIHEPKKVKFLSKIWGFIMFLLRSLVVFPVISFLWFLVLGGFLLFLSKSQDVAQILLMAISIIIVARITAYINEDLSKDIAKLVPFALLGVFIVDPTYFSVEATLNKFYSLHNFLYLIVQYLISLVVLEFLLRSIYRITKLIRKS